MTNDACAQCALHVHCLAHGPIDLLKCSKCGLHYMGKAISDNGSEWAAAMTGNAVGVPRLSGCQLFEGYPPDLPCYLRQVELAQKIAALRATWSCDTCLLVELADKFSADWKMDLKPNLQPSPSLLMEQVPVKVISSPLIPADKIYLVDQASDLAGLIKID